MNKNRCSWPKTDLDIDYHDTEWGNITKSDKDLFEALILETMQSGLSWNTVLSKRTALKIAFDDFDYKICAEYTDEYLEKQISNANIIRHKLKIYSVRSNAQVYIKVIEECTSFYNYIWSFSNYRQADSSIEKKIISEKISKDMKKRGFKFIGQTTIYSFLQAIGMINDHDISCFRYEECNINKD